MPFLRFSEKGFLRIRLPSINRRLHEESGPPLPKDPLFRELKEGLKKLVGNQARLVLFGSRARGDYDSESDRRQAISDWAEEDSYFTFYLLIPDSLGRGFI